MISRVRRKILAGALLTAVNALPLSRALSATPRDYGRPPNVPSDDLLTRIWLGQNYLKIHPEECSASRISYVLFGDEYVNLRRLNNREVQYLHGAPAVGRGWAVAVNSCGLW